MSAQIRPNRMEVTDRFPMLGFSVRAGEPDVSAEVVLATDIGLFEQQNRASRTAANFYSSREHGLLTIPRGEGVFVVPSEVLARFIGRDKLYFGLASGPKNNGDLHVDALPREGSPYVTLRGFTGRTLRRSFSPGRPVGPPVLEWSGDLARPGAEPSNGHGGTNGSNGANGANGRASAPVAAAAGSDEGLGEMPARPPDQRARARRITGAFSERIGEALDLGLAPQSLDPLLDVLEPQAGAAPLGHARSKAAEASDMRQSPPPAPRARAMDGGASAAIAIGGFIVETIRDSRGDISWDLDQFRGIKHPNDVAPASPGAFHDAPTINLDDWPIWEGVDDISAWFKVDWQYNGTSLGNVRITNTGTNDAIGFGLHVTAKIMDDNQVHPPSNCAALRLTFHYRFDRSIGSEGIATRDLTLYGDGTHQIDGRWLQSSAFAREQRARPARSQAAGAQDMRQAPPPAPRARAMNDVAIAIGGFAVETLRDSRGDITWDLDQFRGIKHPNDVAPASPGPFHDAPSINLNDWPIWEGVDDISAWFKVDWQYNGTSLGNVRITNTGTNDAIGFSLHVTAKIMDDNQVYPPSSCAALRLTFHYRFDRSIGSEGIAIREVTLYGDGTHAIDGRWLQSSAFAREQRRLGRSKSAEPQDMQQTPPPAPRARALDGGASAAIAIGGFIVETIRDNRGDISWDLDQFRGIKHPNDVAPASPGAFRDAPTINLDDWPVWEGVDDISAWFKIDWQYNGTSLGNVRITNTGTNDAIGFGLQVTAKIMDDNQVHPPSNCAALRITFHYRFDRSIGSEGIAIRDVILYGDGTHAIEGRWLQSSALAHAPRERRVRA